LAHLQRRIDAGAVARVLGVTPAVATGLVDRLERRGYLRPEPGPGGDRRSIAVVATAEGRRAVAAATAALAIALIAWLAGMSAEDRGTFARGIAVLGPLAADLA
jgi:DNA-binding MarR family transcriptional regulator